MTSRRSNSPARAVRRASRAAAYDGERRCLDPSVSSASGLPRRGSAWNALLTTSILLAMVGCGAGAEESDAQGLCPPDPPAGTGRMAEELDPLVEELFTLELSPGLAVAVVVDGDLVYLRGFGYADVEQGRPVVPDETRFYIASSTKSFTGLATALLAHRDLLDLDAPLDDYLPELTFETDLSPDRISIRDVLTMTDGMAQSDPFVFRTAYSGEFTESGLIELLSRVGPASSGRGFAYRNQPYNILGMIIGRTTGLGWKEAVKREVLDPLGLASTSAWMSRVDPGDVATPYVVAPHGFGRVPQRKVDANMHAAGGHVTTALDLSRWIEAFLGGGVVDGERVFPQEVIDAAISVQAVQDRDFSFFHRHGWGYGWDIGTYDTDTLVHRFGAYTGSRPHISFMPRHGIGVVALVNEASLGGRLVDLVATRIYDYLLGKPVEGDMWDARIEEARRSAEDARLRMAEDLEVRAGRQRPMPLPISAYAGRYKNEALGTMTWRASEGGLEVVAGHIRSRVEVFDAEAQAVRVELTGRGEVVTFLVVEGRVVGLRYRGREFVRVFD